MRIRTHWGLEYSVHDCPSRLARELKIIFPKADVRDIRVIPTCQKAHMDMTNWGEEVETEKSELLQKFCCWAEELCRRLMSTGYWADYIDPCSGLPMVDKKSTQPYNEVEGFSVLLGYKQIDAGACKVISHPEWGMYVYPATVFSNAPSSMILAEVQKMESESP